MGRRHCQWTACSSRRRSGVGAQTIAEAAKIGIEVGGGQRISISQPRAVASDRPGRLRFRPSSSTRAASSKASMAKTRTRLIEMFRDTPYRLLLHGHAGAERHRGAGGDRCQSFLGIMTRTEMLARWLRPTTRSRMAAERATRRPRSTAGLASWGLFPEEAVGHRRLLGRATSHSAAGDPRRHRRRAVPPAPLASSRSTGWASAGFRGYRRRVATPSSSGVMRLIRLVESTPWDRGSCGSGSTTSRTPSPRRARTGTPYPSPGEIASA